MASDIKTWIMDVAALAVFGCALFFATAKLRPLSNPDEGRYAEIPREMAASADYITPRLNGIPYFYKPPLFYWLQCASMKAFGVGRVSARFANSAMAIFGALLLYAAARVLRGRRAGLFSAAILLTSILYYVAGSMVTLDMTVAALISGALFCCIVGLKKGGAWLKPSIMGFFVFCALAVLAKGLIGAVIPCAVVALYALFGGRGARGALFEAVGKHALFCAAAVAVFFAIAAPWHVAAALANPPEAGVSIFSSDPKGQGFLWYYFVHEHFLRYLDSSTSNRAAPFWFFLAIAPAGFLPWVLFLPRAIKSAFAENSGMREEAVFMLVWICFVVGFFSLSSSKLVPYITPVYPAAAFLVGAWLASVFDNLGKKSLSPEKYIFAGLGYFLAVAAGVAVFLIKPEKVFDAVLANARVFLPLTCVVMAAISTAALRFALRGENKKFLAAAFAGISFALAVLNVNGAPWQRLSAEEIASDVRNIRPSEPVAIGYDYGFFHDLPLWLGEVPLYWGKVPDEQEFGFSRESAKHQGRVFTNAAQLEKYLRKHRVLWLVYNTKHEAAMLAGAPAGLQMRVLARRKSNVLAEISLKDEK